MFLLTPCKKRVQATRIAPSWRLAQEKQMRPCTQKKLITFTVRRHIPPSLELQFHELPCRSLQNSYRQIIYMASSANFAFISDAVKSRRATTSPGHDAIPSR